MKPAWILNYLIGLLFFVNLSFVKAQCPVIDSASASAYAVCSGAGSTLMVTAHGGVGPYTYAWKQGAAPVGTNSSAYFTGALTAASTYSVVVTGANACAVTSNSI